MAMPVSLTFKTIPPLPSPNSRQVTSDGFRRTRARRSLGSASPASCSGENRMFAFPFQIKPAGEPGLYPNLRETDKSWLRAGKGGGRTFFLLFLLAKRAGPNANGGSSALAPAYSISIKPKFRMSRGNCTEKSCPGTLTAHAPNTQYQPYWILKVSEYRIHPRTLAGRHEHPINARRKLGYRASARGKCTETADPSAMKAESAGLLRVSRNSWPKTTLPALSK